jgi:dTMP kinase
MRKNLYPGKFIVMEGLDGSGQSTQAGFLKDFLIAKGYQVVLTKEPTQDSEAGKKIRQVLDKKEIISPRKLQELFTKDRKEHLENAIIPALRKAKIVISDRYFFSTFAYGTAEGLDLNWLIKLNNDCLLPDLTFILRVSAGVCISRIKKRGVSRTYFEEKEKLSKVWQVYELLPNHFENINIINGEKSKGEVFSQIKRVVLSQLLNKKIKKEVYYGKATI